MDDDMSGQGGTMSATHQVACWAIEQGVGHLFTLAQVKERLPWLTVGSISGALTVLSRGTKPLLRVQDRKARPYVFRVERPDLPRRDFRGAPRDYVRRSRTKKPREDRPLPETNNPKRAALALSVFREYGLIQALTDDELWDELGRRDQNDD